MERTHIVVLSGAGVSAESGIRTFRAADGLWEEHRIEDVATPEAWQRDPELVLRFYNARRAQLLAVQPNAAHRTIAALEDQFEVDVVTQNVDDLHERSGSTRVLHLHGELRKVRSTRDPDLVQSWDHDLQLGDRCPLGSQLRPHIVWFGEQVPLLPKAAEIVKRADIVIVVGTSLQVYPAAGLIHAMAPGAELYAVDPSPLDLPARTKAHIKEKASIGIPMLASRLRDRFSGR
ncbi:MAG: NAD-dependent deacylase [Flavobacteriales bacterium]|nr:NAD-dependent deacylase [Flavobacteriales bacterium]